MADWSWPIVIDLVLARKAIDAGVDGLACISAGAGGHTGHLSPFAFVSAVRDLFDGLVTVGGGIANGAGVAGAVAAGADLVYMGHAVPGHDGEPGDRGLQADGRRPRP